MPGRHHYHQICIGKGGARFKTWKVRDARHQHPAPGRGSSSSSSRCRPDAAAAATQHLLRTPPCRAAARRSCVYACRPSRTCWATTSSKSRWPRLTGPRVDAAVRVAARHAAAAPDRDGDTHTAKQRARAGACATHTSPGVAAVPAPRQPGAASRQAGHARISAAMRARDMQPARAHACAHATACRAFIGCSAGARRATA